MKHVFYVIIVFLISCEAGLQKDATREPIEDPANERRAITSLERKPFSSLENTVPDEDEETVARKASLQTAIDSTYSAMGQIELIKDDINNLPATSYSVQERNYRSKSLMQLNLIQNTLCRQVDSALLINLKMQTNQLLIINEQIAANSTHLKQLSLKLEQAAAILQRIGGILGSCISRGIIKPALKPAAK